MSISDLEPVGPVALRVAPDVEQAPMVEPMMAGTEGDEVVRVGSASVLPVVDVVDVQAAPHRAPGSSTAPITMFDLASQSSGHDALGSPDRERSTVLEPDGGQRGITGDQVPEVVR